MDDWVRLIRVQDCPPGAARFVTARGRELAVFHLIDPDEFVVTNNSCPHAGGNLSAGEVRDRIVTCPWHHWQFDLDTGTCPLSERLRLRRFDCRIEGDYVAACVPAAVVGDGAT